MVPLLFYCFCFCGGDRPCGGRRHSGRWRPIEDALLNFPKIHRENMEWRREILVKASSDLVYREQVRELFFRDILFAFNAFFFTLDIRVKPYAVLPFCTYDFQDDAIVELASVIESADALHTHDLLWEKSRDMGATWMILLTFEWFWLNQKRPYDFLCGSRKEDYVDKIGDPRTHFHKLRFNLYKLPQWLVPEGFDKRKHDNFLKLENPVSGGSITGESNNANFSTQGRYSGILFDEFAKWETTDDAAWTAAGDATPVRIANSTPFGAAGKHYELATNNITKKVVLHWSLHPNKREGLYCVWPKPRAAGKTVDEYHWQGKALRSPYYDRECIRRKPQEIAQELDIDYIGAGFPVFDGASGERIQALLRYSKSSVCYLPHIDGWDKERYSLEKVPSPHEYEDYFKVFIPPSVNKSYIVVSDVAEGKVTSDASVVKVLERETESIAASYNSQLNEVDLAKVIWLVTQFYTFPEREEPWWAVEANGPGLATFDLLVENLDLPNPYMMMKFDTAKQSPSYRKGWWTDTNSKRSMVASIRNWLITGTGWCDAKCCGELVTFIRTKHGKAEAKVGCNDDEVIALGIALEVNKAAPWEELSLLEEDFLELEDHIRSRPAGDAEPTLEERCLATVIAKQKLTYADDYVGSIDGELSEMLDF